MLKRITTAAFLGATLAQAQPSSLSGQQISELVAGATVEIETPLGTKLPVHYGRDGRLSAEAGALASYLGADADKGRWWVAGDQLCHKWHRWFGSEPQCIRLGKEGRIIHLRSQDGYAFTATIAAPPAALAKAAPPPAEPDRPGPKAALEVPAPRPAASDERPRPSAEPAGRPPQAASKEAVVQAALIPPVPIPASRAPLARAAAAPSASPPSQPRPQAQPQPGRGAQPGFRVVNVRSHDVLNVRSGPSADFDVVGSLPPASRGIAITSACRSEWCPVQHRSTNGWVNSAYLAPEQSPLPRLSVSGGLGEAFAVTGLRDAPDAPRTCLTAQVHALLDRIERQFGPVKVISTCRPGALIAGTSHLSRHASGNAVDFLASHRKAAIVEWLITNHRDGGIMTYANMDHIHVDIGPHFVSIANGPHWLSWRDSARDFPHLQRPVTGAN